MDILNFISWIKGGRVVTKVDPAKTLLPVGLKDNKRDDGYLAGAISVADLTTQLTPEPTYKVFTALLTQNGGDNFIDIFSGNLTIGVTYRIFDDGAGLPNWDFTNVGAPNNDLFTYFIATGTTPNSWGTGIGLQYNTGAPVVTVLENTIGNIWFTIDSDGLYLVYSDNLFTNNKTLVLLGTLTNNSFSHTFVINGAISTFMFDLIVQNSAFVGVNGELANTPIEIRVYN